MLAQIGLALTAPPPPREGEASPVPLASINADGWTGTYPAPPASFDPEASPKTVTVTRQGFDATATPVSVTETLTVMTRLRQPYPDQTTLTADQVALSDFVYQGDSIAGVTNASTRPYPKPVAMWLTPDLDRATTGTFTVRLAVAHAHARAGRPVAAVRFIVSDGTASAQVLVSAMTGASYAETGLTVPCFESALDLSGLAEGICTVDAVIYPWIGDAFTVSAEGDAWPSPNLAPLRVLNDRLGGYGTAYAYLDPVNGSDATGAASADAPTAAAAPFAGIAAAVAAIRDLNAASFGRADAGGGVVRLVDGEHVHAAFAGAAGTTTVPLVIEGASRAGTVYRDAGVSTTSSLPGHVVFRNLTLRKTGGSIVFLDGSDLLRLDNVRLDLNGQTEYDAWLYRVGRVQVIDSADDGLLGAFGTAAKMVHLIGSRSASDGSALYDAAASDMRGAFSVAASGGRVAATGQFFGHCRIWQTDPSKPVVKAGSAIGPRGFALVGSVLEAINDDTSAALWINADGNVDPVENALLIGNTVVGARSNLLYQDTGTATVAKSGYMRFNVHTYRNTKSDVFGADGNLVGNWPFAFNAGARGNVALRGDNAGNAVTGTGNWLGEARALGDRYGSIAAPINPDWADDASFYGSGLGGGDYTPGAASELPGIPAGDVAYPLDLAGRALTDDGPALAGAMQPL